MSSTSTDYLTQAENILGEVIQCLETNQNEPDDELKLPAENVLDFMEREKRLLGKINDERKRSRKASFIVNLLSGSTSSEDLYKDAEILLQDVKSAIRRAHRIASIVQSLRNPSHASGTGRGSAASSTNGVTPKTAHQPTNNGLHSGGRRDMHRASGYGPNESSPDVSESHATSKHGTSSIEGRTHLGTPSGIRSKRASPMINARPLTPESMQSRTQSTRTDYSSAATSQQTNDEYKDAHAMSLRSSTPNAAHSVSHSSGKNHSTQTGEIAISREPSRDQTSTSAEHHKSSVAPVLPVLTTRSTKPKILKAPVSNDKKMGADEHCQSSRRAGPPPPQITTEPSIQSRASHSRPPSAAQTSASNEYLSPHSAAPRMSREPSYDRANTSSRYSQSSWPTAPPPPTERPENIRVSPSRSSYGGSVYSYGSIHAPNSIGLTANVGGSGNSGSVINFMAYPSHVNPTVRGHSSSGENGI